MESGNNFFSSKSFKNYLWRNYIVRYFYKEFEFSKGNDYMKFKLGLFEELLEIDNSKPIHWNMKDLKRKVYCILDYNKNSFKTEKDIQKRDFKNNTEHFGLSICYLLMFIIRGVIKTPLIYIILLNRYVVYLSNLFYYMMCKLFQQYFYLFHR